MAAATQIEVRDIFPQPGRFDPEFELLLASCSSASRCDKTSLLAPDLDWERVLKSAEHHRLIPALHAAFSGKDGVPSTLRVRAHKHAWRVLHFTVELTKIAGCFERRGIEFLAHKGPALAQLLYGSPAMRQFGDLDLNEIRCIFADTPLARQRKYTPGTFSFNVAGGRCEWKEVPKSVKIGHERFDSGGYRMAR